MKRCPKGCLVLVDDNDNYCPDCGKELVAIEKCSCGANRYKTQKFCPKCGKKR